MNTNVDQCKSDQRVAIQQARRVASPRCDIHESDASIFVTAEMPGVEASAVEITVERDVLTLVGRATPIDTAGFEPVWREFETVDYRRSFTLSGDADVAGIRASVRNGLVRIEVPKRVAKQRKIPVNAG